MQLTDDQKAAHAAFIAFMISDDKELVISGPAGVGKTTLLRYLHNDDSHDKIAQLMGEHKHYDWVFSATTNKAAEVLQKSLGVETSTIHSCLGLTISQNYETGKTELKRNKGNAKIIRDSIIVIDEASMIDRDLDQYIYQGTIGCKIIYVGDHCQMAPIGEKLSPVFARNTPAELKQIVRSQHAPAITALCNQLRETVETGVFKPIQGVPGFIDYLSADEAIQEINTHFVDGHNTTANRTRYLAYRNSHVIAVNNWIRQQRQMPPNFMQDEWVIANTPIMTDTGNMLHVEEELYIEEIIPQQDLVLDTKSEKVTIRCNKVITSRGGVLVADDHDYVQKLLKHFAKQREWFTYFHLKEQIADLRARDACTVYKAQGSTYETVFVDLQDIGRCPNPDQAARMLYVACSRPTHRICFIGDLPARFRGE